MKREDVLKRAKDPKYIPGIYNYCDRWCERCAFTSRCLNFSMVEEKFGDLEKKDEMNEAFWERLSEIFEETLAMVKDMAREHGIDIESIQLADMEDTTEENGVAHLFCHLARNYERAVDKWFETQLYPLDDREKRPNHLHLVGDEVEPQKKMIITDDAFDVVRWYQYQINIKLKRAVESVMEEVQPEPDDYPKDSDGSAKVALIGIDRSLSAWGVLLERFVTSQDQIRHLIATLENIRTRVETHFPHARDFVRPGFDTE